MKRFQLPVFFLLVLLQACGKKSAETKPIRKDITETVFASGILEANGTYHLTAQVDGYLQELNFEEGDLVTPGNILAVVVNKESELNRQSTSELLHIASNNTQPMAPLLAEASKSIALAKEKMEQDALQEKRYESLWQKNSVARIDVENARLAHQTSTTNYQTALDNYRKLQQDAQQQFINQRNSNSISQVVEAKNQIRALVGGRVYKKLKEKGDYVKKGDVLAEIGDPNFIYAKINVDESSIARIKLGQEAIIQLNTGKGKNYRGTVAEINPSFNEATQSFICKIQFIDSLDFRIINTQLQTNIQVGNQKNALLIPRNFIDYGGFVQIKGRAQKTKIITRIVSNEWVEVISGIDDETILVTDNIASNNIKTSEAGAQMTH